MTGEDPLGGFIDQAMRLPSVTGIVSQDSGVILPGRVSGQGNLIRAHPGGLKLGNLLQDHAAEVFRLPAGLLPGQPGLWFGWVGHRA